MTSRSMRPAARYAGLAALAAVLLVGTPSVAPVSAVAADDSGCATTATGTAANARTLPGRGKGVVDDSGDFTASERARSEAERTRSLRSARSMATVDQLPASILVPIYVHIIQGNHERERTVSKAEVRRVVNILRAAYRGDQSSFAATTRFSFTIKSFTVTRNDRWYHARMGSADDQQMKRRLHRGFSRALNLYINAPRGPQGTSGLLGFARFPWQYDSNKTQDGVTVHAESLPGGSYSGFNAGDTVVHEVGHWLGLFHTFQSSKSDPCMDTVNDGVADTPAEKEPNGRRPNGPCDNPSNLCDPTLLLPPDALRDPVFNFMDYASDRCMREFTQGQSDRMDLEYALYRY